jgi:hypothetical protein
MDDAPATPKPRRRWKRWAALALVLTIGCGAWLASWQGETIERAKALRIGQTKDEVAAILGQPYRSYNLGKSSQAIYATKAELAGLKPLWLAYKLLYRLGLQHWTEPPRYPVHVTYDSDGRVVQFERGDEVVEK